MKRKGMLLASEVLKIVLAVISISFFVYLLFSLYYANVEGQRREEAQAVIDQIKLVVEGVLLGPILEMEITEINPAGWTFFSYTGNEKKPNSCSGESCLCICDSVVYDNVLWFKDRQLEECAEEGVCLPIKNLKEFNDFEIKSPSEGGTSIKVKNDGGSIEVIEI